MEPADMAEYRKILVFALTGILLAACILPLKIGVAVSNRIDVEALLLDVSTFPEGWSAAAEGPMRPGQAPLGGLRAIARTSLTFYAPNNVAGQHVQLFQGVWEAQQEFDRQALSWFPESEFWSAWEKPEELTFQSSIADRYQVACAESGDLYCGMLGQYQAILIRFSAVIMMH